MITVKVGEVDYSRLVSAAVKVLAEKSKRQREWQAYYDGEHPLVFTTEKLRKTFPDVVSATFTENWVAVCADAVLDRLEINGFSAGKDEVTAKRIGDEMRLGDWASLFDDVHRSVVVTGEAFVVMQEGTDSKPEAYCQPSSSCVAVYDPDHPKNLLFVVKVFYDDLDEVWRTFVHTDTLTFKFRGTKKSAYNPASYSVDGDPVVTDRMPVIHFRAGNGPPVADFKAVLPLQDSVNKLFSDLMVTADACAFPFRYAVSASTMNVPAIKPGDFLVLPGAIKDEQPTSVGQLTPSPLTVYTEAKGDLAHAMSSITRTPRHYFIGGGAQISGEALYVQESPLVKKVRRYSARMDGPWREFASRMMAMLGVTVNPEDLTVLWADPRTVQPLSEAQTREINVRAGIPIETQLKEQGWSESDLDEMRSDAGVSTPSESLPPDADPAVEADVEARMAGVMERTAALIGDLALTKILESGRLDEMVKKREETKP